MPLRLYCAPVAHTFSIYRADYVPDAGQGSADGRARLYPSVVQGPAPGSSTPETPSRNPRRRPGQAVYPVGSWGFNSE